MVLRAWKMGKVNGPPMCKSNTNKYYSFVERVLCRTCTLLEGLCPL